MNVGELEELLAMLPKDMPVMVSAGSSCRHVDIIHKRDRRRVDTDWAVALSGLPVRQGDPRQPQRDGRPRG